MAVGLVLAAADVQAQTFRLGVKGGIASTKLIGGDAESDGPVSSLTGGIAGAFLTARLGRSFALQPEILWARKGARVAVSEDPSFTFDAEFRANYIEIPLLLQGVIALPGDKVIPRIFAGPSFGYQLDCKVATTIDGVTEEEDCDEESEVSSTDWGAVMGIGTEVDLGRLALVFDLRTTFGLTKLDDSEENLDIRNRSYSAMAGISIPLGQRTTLAAARR
jgi:hypothetical protein